MATLTIKNVPELLYKELKQKAANNHRSLNSEAIVSLLHAVHQPSVSASTVLLKARELRVKENISIKLNDKIIHDAKNEGRS
ncbi:MAG: Arc family DNA-binding protein [Gammaproteobacteria bacterium]|nr:Arc family DNA-binding protein [Gammaproteobacteria bacterium]